LLVVEAVLGLEACTVLLVAAELLVAEKQEQVHLDK